jgi:hypothetical protein
VVGNAVHRPHVGALAVLFTYPERPRLDEWVGPEEVPVQELDLVVGVVLRQLARVVGIDQVVPALLDDGDRPPGPGENVGRGRSSRP